MGPPTIDDSEIIRQIVQKLIEYFDPPEGKPIKPGEPKAGLVNSVATDVVNKMIDAGELDSGNNGIRRAVEKLGNVGITPDGKTLKLFLEGQSTRIDRNLPKIRGKHLAGEPGPSEEVDNVNIVAVWEVLKEYKSMKFIQNTPGFFKKEWGINIKPTFQLNPSFMEMVKRKGLCEQNEIFDDLIKAHQEVSLSLSRNLLGSIDLRIILKIARALDNGHQPPALSKEKLLEIFDLSEQ